LVTGAEDENWYRQQIECLPERFLAQGQEKEAREMLERLHSLPHDKAIAWGRYDEERNAVEFSVGTYEEIVPGVFHRLTGALTSKRLQILSAEINTLAYGLVLDRFYVQDLDFTPPPTQQRLEEIAEALVKSLVKTSEEQPQFRTVWGATAEDEAVEHLPSQVRLDNATADRHTIVTVFSYNRLGLLYAITRALFELELSVRIAKISTSLDQIVDVFYVTDRFGNKVEDEQHLLRIRSTLEDAIEAKLQTTN
jgi:[protein-PII] uridylyltransferase